MHVSLNVQDDSKRLPIEYFDLERVNMETLKAYHAASQVWRMRWRSLVKKGKEYMYKLGEYYI